MLYDKIISEIRTSNYKMLSVKAKPFHPVHGKEIDTIIYNDGIPCLSFQGTDTEFLHSITDDAIDEAFPPTAQEAAELEAVETFVEMMAALAHLEEREEKTRFHPDHTGLGKRWIARRELVGKPRPAKHSIKTVIHHQQPNDANITDLVSFAAQCFSVNEHKKRQRAVSRMVRNSMSNKNKTNINRQQHVPIQQPRKNS